MMKRATIAWERGRLARIQAGLLLFCLAWLALPALAQFPNIKIPGRAKTAIDKAQNVAEATEFTPEQEQAIGKEVAAKLINYLKVYDNPKMAAYVRRVGQAVAMQSERQDVSYHFELLESADVNAFACPGGYIFVTRGLLETVTSESQLAGVLAHEVGHVAGKHVIKALQRGRLIQMGVKETNAYNPGSKYLGDIADKILIRIVDNGLDPGDEYDADQRGVNYAYAAGYRPDGLGVFLEKFMQLSSQSPTKAAWLAHTHPPANERIQRIASLIVSKKMELDTRADLTDRYHAALASQEEASTAPASSTPSSGTSSSSSTASQPSARSKTAGTPPDANSAPEYKAYQNYDFVPGDKIVFEDAFRSDDDGEFPAHWKLSKGQGVVNKVQGNPAFALTEGNYAKVAPRITATAYLTDPFTVEFDFYSRGGGNNPIVFINPPDGHDGGQIAFGPSVSTGYFETGEANQSADYPKAGGAFQDKWHHAALVFKRGQLKCYEDQYRVLVVPDTGKFVPKSIAFGGIGDQDKPLIFTNVRIANGGGMKMVDQLAKEGRVVTHGILFDVNKSIVKPESMGTIRQIVEALNSSSSLKLEIGGHTDSDGDAAKNLALSQARAEAVKKILVDQGIDAARLTAKGYGATKPIQSNATPEGKANNRRVEFVKL